ncbi:YihY/virulence factor BrkB family protein [Arenimonas composti]|uniref:Uncharacterized protein n=1 Tax=Arenimonas composti TR7-09 = DSM 18010 TaxID=1121013 RepID=A0A091B923_9GAMM|nr:YihY/virulence factor BrkB family protein [Arenimonas composti]KFN48251.1 hypothetical protein P873_01455 [Arenimonas composti TR7-09 = DSM 18010]
MATPGERKHPWLQRAAARLESSFAWKVASRFIAIDLLAQAAALSLYALISLAPLLLIVLWLTASLMPSAQDALVAQIAGLAGDAAGEVAATIIANAESRPDLGSVAGWWNTALLFVAATIVFAHLQSTLNLIFATSPDELRGGALAWLRKRVFSFGIVFALGFLLLVSMTLTTAVQFAFARVPTLVPAMADIVSLLVYAFAFALLYRFLPDRRVRWAMAFVGGTLTASLFVLGRWGIGQWLAYSAPASPYGAFAAPVLMLVWMYYAALVFFGSALVTAVLDETAGKRPTQIRRPS